MLQMIGGALQRTQVKPLSCKSSGWGFQVNKESQGTFPILFWLLLQGRPSNLRMSLAFFASCWRREAPTPQLFHRPLGLHIPTPATQQVQDFKILLCHPLWENGVEVPFPTTHPLSNYHTGANVARRTLKASSGQVQGALKKMKIDQVCVGQYGRKIPLDEILSAAIGGSEWEPFRNRQHVREGLAQLLAPTHRAQ